MLKSVKALYPWLRHVFAAGGYAGPKLNGRLAKIGKWTIQIVKRSDATGGFELLPRRWVVERTFAWLGRCGRLAKDFETTVTSTTAWLYYHSRLQAKLDDPLKIVPATKADEKLLRVIKRFRQNLFVFITNRAIPPTNNGSEQALRPCVVFRKVTNCFRSEWGATLYANVRSVLEIRPTTRYRNPSRHQTHPQ